MSGASLKRFALAAIFCVSLSAELALAQLTNHVTPKANEQTTLADIKKHPNTPVTLTQALALLKAPELRNAKGILKESITIHLDAGTYRISETLHLDAASSGSDEHMVMIEGKLIMHYGDIKPWAFEILREIVPKSLSKGSI